VSRKFDPSKDKAAVAEAVRAHFEGDLKVDNVKLVAAFLRIKKDEKDGLNYNLRKPNRPRTGYQMASNQMSDALF
jgi:hypothetical protein